jgi:hypothetical protein
MRSISSGTVLKGMFRSLRHSGAARLRLLFSGAVFRPWCLVAVVGLAGAGGPVRRAAAGSDRAGVTIPDPMNGPLLAVDGEETALPG